MSWRDKDDGGSWRGQRRVTSHSWRAKEDNEDPDEANSLRKSDDRVKSAQRGRGRTRLTNDTDIESRRHPGLFRGQRAGSSRNGTFHRTKHVSNRPGLNAEKMNGYLKLSSNEVILSINNEMDEWKKLLESEDLTDEKLLVVIEVIAEKICVDTDFLRQQQMNSVVACCSKSFISKLEDVVSNIYYEKPAARNQSRLTTMIEISLDTSDLRVFSNVYKICNFIVKTLPASAADFFEGLIVKSYTCSNAFPDLQTQFKDLMDELKNVIVSANKKEVAEKRRKKRPGFSKWHMDQFDWVRPPEDIRCVSVIPSIQELRSSGPTFLRPNKTEGAYNDSKHYLDVQFRLLREDFVQPIRSGIQTFLKDDDRNDYIQGKKRLPRGELYLYPDVRIFKVVKEQDTMVYKLQLPDYLIKGKGAVNWEKSKKLLPKNLVIMTTVEKPFQDDNTYFGVVFSRDLYELSRAGGGLIGVEWVGTPPSNESGESFLLFESEVYLEAYLHTLKTLKNLNLHWFPMKKFIVDASDEVTAPRYLERAGEEDEPLVVKVKNENDDLLPRVPFPSLLFEFTKLREEDGYRLVSLEEENWPSAEEFGFDDNQLQAFKAAVTKEFSIIQGPPGTGKTFLGLKVTETFLNNSKLWKSGPITVVCYTNHALDQFLQGILKYYCKTGRYARIARLGGRCQSAELEPYTLGNIRKKYRHYISDELKESRNECFGKIKSFELIRQETMNQVTGLLNIQGVVDFERLKCWEDIEMMYPELFWYTLKNRTWLGLDHPQLKNEWFSDKDLINKWFKVHISPQKVSRKVNFKETRKVINEANDGKPEAEENYDLNELLADRILDSYVYDGVKEINQEALTSYKSYSGLRYVPNTSVQYCSASLRELSDLHTELRKRIRWNDVQKIRELKTLELESVILRNCQNFLNEIFRLHKDRRLDLPDVTTLLKQISEEKVVDYNKLRMDQRWALYFQVVEKARISTMEMVADVDRQLKWKREELNSLREYGDRIILRQLDVVGLTTTGAAKYNHLLKEFHSKIVIVEEAAEVFEAHIVTSITESCEQLILIGDHRQLRPNPTVYELAKKFSLDVSLFERMLNNDLHCYQLKVQHRMRPDISDLVRDTIYEELIDHESVAAYPDVKGMTKNVFLISHTEMEKEETDSGSKSNLHEAQFIAALCRHLTMQGYGPKQITVLTMYTGQMFLLKKEIEAIDNCKEIRVTCVDNFQGEENDIILLSLVRSNDKGSVGFVRVDNRICVSLSRAKHGLYIIGNMAMIQEKSDEWKKIKEKLERKSLIGDELELACQNHGTHVKVKKASDFHKVSPDGGCTQMCNTPLKCGHFCEMLCHGYDNDHILYECRKPCNKLCQNGLHPCEGFCFQICSPPRQDADEWKQIRHRIYYCREPVERTLPCGHVKTLQCFINPETYRCNEQVERKLKCGHLTTVECHVGLDTIKCQETVLKELSCGHSQLVECHVAPKDIDCKTVIQSLRKCGHETEIKCFRKNELPACKEACSASLECGHPCKETCNVVDDPKHLFHKCQEKCERKCPENHLCGTSHPCWQQCLPCETMMERKLPCGHEKKLECHVDLKTYKCQEKCEKVLPKCGHACHNLCFENCEPCKLLVMEVAPCGHEIKVLCGHLALKENCEQLVPPKNTPECGHVVSNVPCKHEEALPSKLVEYCEEPCNHAFNAGEEGCSHKCTGKCNTCFQGRIHVKCEEKCGKQFICGHQCEGLCSAICEPCNKPCLMECLHGKCKNKCGEQCFPCKEKCPRSCIHLQCTKPCGVKCDIEPCMEACPKTLEKCGHPCMGYCGEPCPPLCILCDHDERDLAKVMFGKEKNDETRLIYLPDCMHTIEAVALEEFLSPKDGKIKIQIVHCPLCETPITTCRRFHNLVISSQEDIRKAKRLAIENTLYNKKFKFHCICKIRFNNDVKKMFPLVHDRICKLVLEEKRVRRKQPVEMVPKELDELSIRSIDFISGSAIKIAEELKGISKGGKLTTLMYSKVVADFDKTFTLMLDRHPLSTEEISSLNEELDRNEYLKQMRLREIDHLLETDLKDTERPRHKIINVLDMVQGHWLKCQQGHIYNNAITENDTCEKCDAQRRRNQKQDSVKTMILRLKNMREKMADSSSSESDYIDL